MTILTRHILVEVLKVLLLTCTVLVTVIAFGAAIRPLSRNQLGAFDTVKYVALATIPMLQYALPIAAGFAATLVLHRFAADNEIQAMSTSGVPYRRILRPVTLLGLGLVGFMLVLLFTIEPRFWVVLQSTVTRDAARMFVATVEGGHPFVLDKIQIHADEVREIPAPADSGADSRLLLAGVVVVEFGDDGGPQTELTAEQATIDVHRTPEGTFLKPVLGKATVFRALDGTLVELPRAELQAARIDRPFVVRPGAMTLGQMRTVTEDPSIFPPVAESLQRLRAVAGEAQAWRSVQASLQGGPGGTVILEQPQMRRRFEIRNARLEGERLVPAGEGPLLVIERQGADVASDRPVRQASAAFVQLSANQPDRLGPDRMRLGPVGDAGRSAVDVADDRVTFELALADTTPMTLAGQPSIEGSDVERLRWPRRVSGLHVLGERQPDLPAAGADLLRAADTIGAEAATAPGPSERLSEEARAAERELADRVQGLRRHVVAEIAARVAQALSALLLPLLGAVLAIWRRSAQPLEVYIVSFLPTIVSVLLISAGERLVRNGNTVIGMGTLWSGSALLGSMLTVAWVRMARH